MRVLFAPVKTLAINKFQKNAPYMPNPFTWILGEYNQFIFLDENEMVNFI
jgi:hypothetical protein